MIGTWPPARPREQCRARATSGSRIWPDAADVSVDTIRFYQKRQLLPPPRREGRIAWYGPEHVERLARIKDLQRRGLLARGDPPPARRRARRGRRAARRRGRRRAARRRRAAHARRARRHDRRPERAPRGRRAARGCSCRSSATAPTATPPTTRDRLRPACGCSRPASRSPTSSRSRAATTTRHARSPTTP